VADALDDAASSYTTLPGVAVTVADPVDDADALKISSTPPTAVTVAVPVLDAASSYSTADVVAVTVALPVDDAAASYVALPDAVTVADPLLLALVS
jgi:hypothetical protein